MENTTSMYILLIDKQLCRKEFGKKYLEEAIM